MNKFYANRFKADIFVFLNKLLECQLEDFLPIFFLYFF